MNKEVSVGNLAECLNIYKTQIIPILKQLEFVRHDMLNKFYKKIFIIVLIILSISIYIGSRMDTFSNRICLTVWTLIIFTLPLLGGYFDAKEKENIKFKSIIKTEVLSSLLKIFGDIEWYGRDPDISNGLDDKLTYNEINESGLFLSFYGSSIDDEYQGTYKDIPFKIFDIRMFNNNDKGKKRKFEGVIISFKFNKKIEGKTMVFTKGFVEAYDNTLEEVILEDTQFSKRFSVYSTDQVEARYLLTPAFMKRFYDMKTSFGANGLKCSFYGDKLMIAIRTKKDIFEIGNLYSSLLDSKSIKEFYRELNSIYQLVDYFKLNEHTGM